MGMGRYNVETAQARSINSQTAMMWNQYIYESKLQAQKVWAEKENREQAKQKGDYKAIQDRVRNSPTSIDIEKGNALNIAIDELSNPKLFRNAVYYGSKVKVGGEDIRDIPFQYASAAISTSVHQLTQGDPPAALLRDEFGPDREKIKAITAELRKEGEELGTHKPETIKKAKDQIMATKAKVEATFPQNSQERRDAEKYIRAIYGLASMLETPAVNVLLAGVEKRPDATLGDLMDFMATYNLRFGAAETDRQKAVYRKLYPMVARLRDEIVPVPGSNPPSGPPTNPAIAGEVFERDRLQHHRKQDPPTPAQAPVSATLWLERWASGSETHQSLAPTRLPTYASA